MMPLGTPIDPACVMGTPEHAEALTVNRHPGVQAALQWLCFTHLPLDLRPFSQPFYQTAMELLIEIPDDSPELTGALNQLVQTKDWAVRAGIRSKHGRPGPVPRPDSVVVTPVFDGEAEGAE